MANLRDIRNRISSIKNTQKITKAMQMVAAAKLRKAQNRMNEARPFASKVEEVIKRLVSNSGYNNELLRTSENPESVLFIIVGSDRGLCGGFNNNLFKEVEERISKEYAEFQESNNLDMITIGRKAKGYFPKRGYQVIESHNGFFDDINYDGTIEIMQDAIKKFKNEQYDRVVLCYNEFKSVIAQNRIVKPVLPINPATLCQDNMSSSDESEETTDENVHKNKEYIYEPDKESILTNLFPLHLNMQLWRAVLESNAAEQGARMTAMDSATENAKEMEEDLQLEYNQARQSAITTEISEIVSGAQALEEA